jgi:hypothetical protein
MLTLHDVIVAAGLSWNSIVTKFTVMVTDPATIRHVFNHNR